MGKNITLTAADGHKLGAYRADPAGVAKGGVVVIQEIFGVNHHIRSVCDRLAAAGYAAVAPALFESSMSEYTCAFRPLSVVVPDASHWSNETECRVPPAGAPG